MTWHASEGAATRLLPVLCHSLHAAQGTQARRSGAAHHLALLPRPALPRRRATATSPANGVEVWRAHVRQEAALGAVDKAPCGTGCCSACALTLTGQWAPGHSLTPVPGVRTIGQARWRPALLCAAATKAVAHGSGRPHCTRRSGRHAGSATTHAPSCQHAPAPAPPLWPHPHSPKLPKSVASSVRRVLTPQQSA